MADDDKKTAEDERKHAADAEAKRIAQAEDDRKKQAQAEEDRKKQASQRALVPNAEGNVMVEAIMGPYRGNRLTMPLADAEQARDDHWVINPSDMESYDHPLLTDEERTAALTAAHAWAQTQWDAAQGVEDETPPPPEGGEGEGGVAARRRNMTPEPPTGGYTTRATPAPAPARAPPPTPSRKP